MEPLISSFRLLQCHTNSTSRHLLRLSMAKQPMRASSRQFATETKVVVSSTLPEPAGKTSNLDAAFPNVTHARRVPATPSYFSREPQFNDLVVRLTKLLTRYHQLPTVQARDIQHRPWTKLVDIRAQLGEQIKASHYARALRTARRLNMIEKSVRPAEVDVVLMEITRTIDPKANRPNTLTLDQWGRAVGVGKRKESTARAFVVEGTGEVLVNGKTLNHAFGRVHDRESALWALTSTQRLDKYNIWALVEGGGTTGQAEAMTLAVAKALVAHEPGLRPTLRKAGCLSRDARAVERKKHGHVKARKSPAWVKR